MDTFTQTMIDLGVMPAYAVPKCPPQILDDKFRKSFISLFDKKYAGLDLRELCDISKRCTMDVTKEQVLAVFEATTEQSESKLWFELRAGRITASKFKSTCRTKIPRTTDDKTGPRLWCYCNTPDDGTKMINCQNASCRIKWFHRRCIEIKRLPKGKWFCKTCLRK